MTDPSTVSFGPPRKLPADMESIVRLVLQRSGVVFHGTSLDDPTSIDVTLPKHWLLTKRGMLDEQGRLRAFFRVQPFWGVRVTTVVLARRFGIYFRDADEAVEASVTDGRNVVYASPAHPYTDPDAADYLQAIEHARNEAYIWLNKHYPKWRDSAAYWDEPDPASK